jgi:hypothetical protein
MSKSELRFRVRFRLFSFKIPTKFPSNFYIGIPITISESEFRFRHQNSDFGTSFQYQCRNFKAFVTEIKKIKLPVGISISMVEIEIPIIFGEFDQ